MPAATSGCLLVNLSCLALLLGGMGSCAFVSGMDLRGAGPSVNGLNWFNAVGAALIGLAAFIFWRIGLMARRR